MQRPQPVVLADHRRDRDVAPTDKDDDQWPSTFPDDALPIRVGGGAVSRSAAGPNCAPLVKRER
jgi:hypothetical protein